MHDRCALPRTDGSHAVTHIHSRLPAGLRVFLVEDEALVMMNLETMIEDLGCVIAGSAMRAAQLDAVLERGIAADAAILDVNLGGKLVFDHARTFIERGIPIVFATGYGRSGLPEEWRTRPILQKPYTAREVAEGLADALSQRDMRSDVES